MLHEKYILLFLFSFGYSLDLLISEIAKFVQKTAKTLNVAKMPSHYKSYYDVQNSGKH